jgi:hypothetical protein
VIYGSVLNLSDIVDEFAKLSKETRKSMFFSNKEESDLSCRIIGRSV